MNGSKPTVQGKSAVSEKSFRTIGGQQLEWEPSQRINGKPIITIITSTFNAGRDLVWTADSIRKQTYPYVQWVIVDGASKDETADIIKSNEDIVDVWFSEPDEGIYDAWNKACQYIKGEWVQFIGAGDELAASDTLEKISTILQKSHPKYDLVYGNLLYISEVGREPLELVGQPWDKMKGKWELFRPKLPVHPEVFHHVSLFSEGDPFDKRFKIAGDSYFLMKAIKNKDPLYVDVLIDKMPIGGVSGNLNATLESSKETKKASKDLGYNPPVHHVLHENFKLLSKKVICDFLPSPLAKKIADLYRILSGKKPRWTKK